MKRTLTAILSAFLCLPVLAQLDSLELTNEYLDTVSLQKVKEINDYSLIGINWGVTFSNTSFNPVKHDRTFVFKPNAFSIMYTHYEKMFDYIPYFGFTGGFAYGHEGVTFKTDKETGSYLGHVNGATYLSIEMVEVPAMAQIHADFDPAKLMIEVGPYAGYRLSIERSGYGVTEEYENQFYDYERRFDYGLKGGAGFGIMIDPIEIQFMVLARWSWQSLYRPDYYSDYYYRFANPISIIGSVGISYQLTKRKGKTSSYLKKEARKIVYEQKDKDPAGQSWK